MIVRRLAACLLILALCVPALAADAPPAGTESTPTQDTDALKTLNQIRTARLPTLHIDSAELGTGARPCDVTAEILRRCEAHQSCAVEIDNSLCPAHHLPGMIQPLIVTYRCRLGEPLRKAKAEESTRLRLTCPSGQRNPG